MVPRSQKRDPRRSLRLARAPLSGALLVLALGACESLELRPEGVCGNRAVEPGEDCDGQEDCGAPGTDHACRFLCAGDGQCSQANSGYSCGADGVCRRPSGRFQLAAQLVTSFTKDLSTGDVNQDGCEEILHTTVRGTQITALPSTTHDLCPSSTQELPAGQAAVMGQSTPPVPLLADLSADDKPDLIVPARGVYGDGLFLHLARATPTVAPKLFSTVRFLEPSVRPLRVTHRGSDKLFAFLGYPTKEGKSPPPNATVAALEKTDAPAVPLANAVLPGPIDSIAFAVTADLDPPSPDPNTLCDEILLGMRGADEIHVYRICDASQKPMFTHAATVKLGGGAEFRDRNAALSVVDFDGDGALDLLLNTAGQALHVAYGDGTGKFHSAPPGATPADMTTAPLSPADLFPPPIPAGDAQKAYSQLVAGNSRFVAAEYDDTHPGIEIEALPCISDQEAGSPGCEKHSGECESVMADFDADGALDVAFTLGADPSILVARSSKGGSNHVALYSTQCPPRGLAAGDFDGDGINDVAFLDSTAENDASTAELSIAYGRAFATPEDPVHSGRLDLGSGLAAGRFEPNAPGVQIFAGRNAPPDAKTSRGGMGGGTGPGGGVAFVTNRGERVMAAPYYLPGDFAAMENIRQVEFAAATAGRFTEVDPTSSDSDFGVVVLTRDLSEDNPLAGQPGTERLWRLLARGSASAVDAPAGEDQSIGAPACDACLLVPIDTDGDGIDEILFLGGDKQAIVYASGDPPLAERTSFSTARSYRALSADESPPRKYAPRPVVAHLDGDTHLDVLLRATDGALVVFWGRDDGGFDEVPLFDEAAYTDDPRGSGCQDNEKCVAAALNVDGDEALELAVIHPGKLAFYDVDPGKRSAVPIEVVGDAPLVLAGLPPDSDFTAIRAADLDGDGVKDLVVMRSSGFTTVLRSVPESEVDR